MLPADIAAEALQVRTSSIVSVESLKEGLTNASWLVRATDDAVVVRISSPHSQQLQVDRVAEAWTLNLVAEAAIGPEVLLCDLSRRLLVTRYLGPTCAPADMHEPKRIARLAQLLHKLHSLPVPASVNAVSWPLVIEEYLATLTTLERRSPLEQHDRGVRAHALALALELELEEGALRCLCHNDVHHLNIVDRERLWLLDWEYAGSGEPYFDLASVCFYHDFSLRERALLLEAYHGRVDPAALERLAKSCLVFEYVHGLWHEVRASLDVNA